MKWPLLLILLCVPLVFAAYTPPSNTAVNIVLSTGYTPANYQNVVIIIGSIPSGNVTPVNTSCTYSGSGTWNLPCTCNVTDNTVASGPIVFNGSGTCLVTANITNVSSLTWPSNCVIIFQGGNIK